MSSQKSCICQPWIVDLIARYRETDQQQKPIAAQVLAFVNLMEKQTDEPSCPAAAVHISDTRHYIKAFVSKEAKREMEQEEEHYVLSDIKYKVIILRKFSIEFKAEQQLKDCEFYILIQQFRILPMETNIISTPYCNKDPAVQKKTEEMWRDHVAEIEIKEMNCSDLSLTQLLNAVDEEELAALRNLAQQCLDIGDTARPSTYKDTCTLPPANVTQTWWQIAKREPKTGGNVFSVPASWLIIPSEQEEVLANIAEWRNDAVYSGSGDLESILEDQERTEKPSPELEEMQPCPSFLFSHGTPVDENKSTSVVNPWNTFQSVCLSIASSSGEVAASYPSPPELKAVSVGKDKEDENMPHPDSSTPDNLDFSLGEFGEESLQKPSLQDERDEKLSLTPVLFPDSSGNLSQNYSREPNSELGETAIHVDLTPFSNSRQMSSTGINSGETSRPPELRKYSINPVSMSLCIAMDKSCSADSLNSSLFDIPPSGNSGINLSAHVSRDANWYNMETSNSDLLESEEEQHRDKDNLPALDKPQVSKRKCKSCSESDEHFTEAVEQSQIMVKRGAKDSSRKSKCFLQDQSNTNKKPMRKRLVLEFKEVNKVQESREQSHSNAVILDPPSLKPKNCRGQTSSERNVEKPESKRMGSSVKSNVGQGTRKAAPQVHPDGTTFQYQYRAPSPDLSAKVQSVRIPQRLLKWASQMIVEPSSVEDG